MIGVEGEGLAQGILPHAVQQTDVIGGYLPLGRLKVQVVDLAVAAALTGTLVTYGEAAALLHQIIVPVGVDLTVLEAQAVFIPEQAARSDTAIPGAEGVAAGGNVQQQLAAVVALPGGDIVGEILVGQHLPGVDRVIGIVVAVIAAAGRQAQRQHQDQQKVQAILLHGSPLSATVSPGARSNRSRR